NPLDGGLVDLLQSCMDDAHGQTSTLLALATDFVKFGPRKDFKRTSLGNEGGIPADNLATTSPSGSRPDWYFDSDDDHCDYDYDYGYGYDSGRSSPKDYAACSLECGYCGHCDY